MRTNLFRNSLMAVLAASVLYAQGESSPGAGSAMTTRFTVTDLGPVGAPPAQPFVVTNTGLISGGVAVSDTAMHSILWFQGLKIDIGAPGLGGLNNIAFGVNERGQTVGQAETPDDDPNGEDFCGFGSRRVCHPFVWQNGAMATLPPLKDTNGAAGANGVANAINNRGKVVGMAETTARDTSCPPVDPALGQYQQFQFKAVIWENGAARELPGVDGDPDGIAFSINDNGQAVGGSGTCTSYQANGDLTYLYGLHATLWQRDGTVVDLGNLGGVSSGGGNVAIHINNRGQAVGSSGTSDGSFHAFLWSKETGLQDMGTVDDDVASVALANNDRGDVTGISFDGDFNARAFIRWDGGSPADLNSMIAGDSSLYLFDACNINSHGEIVGMGVDADGVVHGFLATPSADAGESPDTSLAASAFRFEHARKLLRQRLASGQFAGRHLSPR